MKVHHIGYAVNHIEKAIPQFTLLGYEPQGEVIEDISRNIKIQFLKNEHTVVELIEAMNDHAPVYRLLQNTRGGTPYHICYEVENMEDAIDTFRKRGCVVIQPAEEAIALNSARVCFLFQKDIGIFELLERK